MEVVVYSILLLILLINLRLGGSLIRIPFFTIIFSCLSAVPARFAHLLILVGCLESIRLALGLELGDVTLRVLEQGILPILRSARVLALKIANNVMLGRHLGRLLSEAATRIDLRYIDF